MIVQTVLINNVDLQTYGISVTKIKGAFDMPARYGTYERDWQDVDGIEAFVNIDDIYYKQRKITLDCIMEAPTMGEFQYQMGLFRELVYTRFTITTPYSTHDCIMKEGSKVKFLNSKYENDIVAEFSLVLNEMSYSFGTTLAPEPDITNDVFWIDRIALSRFGIIVEESEGYFDFPAMKDDKVTRYMRESDKINKRKSRDISLKCSLRADNITDFQTKITQLHSLLAQTGLRQLMLPLPGLERAYEVFCPDGFKLSELYYSSLDIVGRFTIILKEAFPVPETFFLTILLNTEGIPILTELGEYIYVIVDRNDLGYQERYVYQPSELQDDIFVYTKEELDPENVSYDSDAEEIYLFTKEELE